VSLYSGIRSGLRSGIRSGLNPSDSVALAVTRDASNLQYYPASDSEWTTLMAFLGLATGNPSSIWNLQETFGNFADAKGGITLGANNITLYSQTFTGAARKCFRGVDGTANSNARNSTTAPNPAATSTLLIAHVDLPAAPAAQRDVMALATNADLRLNTNGKLRLVAGANADLVNVAASAQRWLALQVNLTASTIKVYNDQEVFTGTFVAPTSAAHVALGGDNAAIPAGGWAYAAQFTAAAAELTQAQIKTLLQGLGATIPW
jgi:hypothetical protein